MSYQAQTRVQITEQDRLASSLRYHEADAAGEPICRQPVRPWRGQTMVLTPMGAGPVDCLKCAAVRLRQS